MLGKHIILFGAFYNGILLYKCFVSLFKKTHNSFLFSSEWLLDSIPVLIRVMDAFKLFSCLFLRQKHVDEIQLFYPWTLY